MPEEPLLEIRDLVRHVPGMDRPLLSVARLELQQRERLGLTGSTGSGKSSLLRAMAMLDPCESLSVRFRGLEVTGETITGFRRTVVYLPQQPSLIASSVRANLTLPYQFGTARCDFQESRAVGLLEKLGKPSEFLNQPAGALSGGERQFVSLVRAIQLDPQILLLDEPTASLDPTSTRKLEDLVMNWHEGSPGDGLARAFVWVSHDMDQIDRMTHRMIEMEGGSLV